MFDYVPWKTIVTVIRTNGELHTKGNYSDLKWSEALLGKQRVCIREYRESAKCFYRYSWIFEKHSSYTCKDVSFFSFFFALFLRFSSITHPQGSPNWVIGSCSDFSSHLAITLSSFLLLTVSISCSLRSSAGFVAAY